MLAFGIYRKDCQIRRCMDEQRLPCASGKQQETLREDVNEEHRNACRKKLAVLSEQRRDLSLAIDQLLSDIETGKKYMKVYKQMKMYNDPNLNPILYGKKQT